MSVAPDLNEFAQLLIKAGNALLHGEPDAPDEIETADVTTTGRREELEAMSVAALRKLAASKGFTAKSIRGASSEELVEGILADEAADSDTKDAVELTTEAIVEMGLRAAKRLAKERGIETAALKGLDVEAVAELILGTDDDEDDDEIDSDDDSDEDDDEIDSDDDSDEDEDDDDESSKPNYTRAQLKKKSLAQLKTIARDECGLRWRGAPKLETLIAKILDAQA